jgi:hypothetical protein
MIMTAPPSLLWSAASKTLLLAAGVCAFAFPAAAQQPTPAEATGPTTPLSSVTVQTAPPAVVTKLSRSFVQAYALRSGKIDQLPRWHQPICVTVRGLVPDHAALIATRVEDVARALGLTVMKPGCQSNIQVMFTGQPQQLADTISEPYLGYHNKSEIKTIRAVTHPIQGWYATSTAGAAGATGLAFAGGTGTSLPSTTNGMALSHGPGSNDTNTAAWESNFGQAHGVHLSMQNVDSPEQSAPVGCADSRFSSCMKSMFANVIVIVDIHGLENMDLGLVSDYVAMLAVSQPRSLAGCNPLPSVIDLFAKPACSDDRDPPDGLTPADAAYLTGLYGSDPEARTASAEDEITGRMAKILISAKAVAP